MASKWINSQKHGFSPPEPWIFSEDLSLKEEAAASTV
jgi:hypothetical protein